MVWEDYAELFDYDHCTAALAQTFEFLCNGELSRMEEAGQEGAPWFTCDIDELGRHMIRLWNRRKVQYSLSELLRTGILDSERRGNGKPNRYRFRYDRVNQALRKRLIFKEGAPLPDGWEGSESRCAEYAHQENGAETVQVDAQFGAPGAHLTLLEEVRRNKEELVVTPIVPSEEELKPKTSETEPEEVFSEDTELTVDTIARAVHNRCHWKGNKPKLGKKATEHLTNRVVGMVNAVGLDRFIDQVNASLADSPEKELPKILDDIAGDWTPKKKTGSSGRYNERSSARTTPTTRNEEIVESAPVGSSDSGAVASTPSFVTGGKVPHYYPDIWNEIVLSRPVEWSLKRSPTGKLAEATADEDFCLRFREICEKAEAIHKADPGATWLTFEWILKTKDGETSPNWWRLLQGQFDFRARAAMPKAKPARELSEVELMVERATANQLAKRTERERKA